MQVHADLPAAKLDALRFQPQPLLHPASARKKNAAARSEHAMPGELPVPSAQGPCHLPRRSFIACGAGNFAVRSDFAFGDSRHSLLNVFEHGCSIGTALSPLPLITYATCRSPIRRSRSAQFQFGPASELWLPKLRPCAGPAGFGLR